MVESVFGRLRQVVEVCKLSPPCHFIFIFYVLAVANGANASKLVDKMRLMCDLYDRPCLIIEKDRVKPGEKERDW